MNAEEAVRYVEVYRLTVMGQEKPSLKGKGTPTAKAPYYWVVGEPHSGGRRGTGLTLADAVEHFLKCPEEAVELGDDSDIM